MSESTQVSRDPVGQAESTRAQRYWWDREAADYYTEHGAFLGDAGFIWGPEGWSEADLGLLGPGGVAPKGPVLEIGAGAAQCSRWLRARGTTVVASDLSGGMLAQSQAIDRAAAQPVPLVQCDGARLPFAEAAFEVVFTAYGVVPFVADSARVMREAARVLCPGGRFVFATTHPIRWAFPDVPGAAGLTAHQSYWDTRPYVERDHRGEVTYVEHHRTLGERVREIVAAGLVLLDLVEPQWPERNEQEWGGWSPTRGRVLPGTAIFVCGKPPADVS
ncbi:MAG: class I SAM-dependent methyltransferase [Tetrasphaera sp.]|nr:class I SAM-dependent methyltransferase [Actinomycetota bacterium]MCB1301742.1 class I SAM-dependent methyltransferase [Tetrasphaera sp.]